MLRVYVYKLKAIKSELNAEYRKISALAEELHDVNREINRIVSMDDVRFDISSEIELLENTLVVLKEYIKAFEIIIESYEVTEQQLVEEFGPLRRFGSNIQVDVLDNSFLTDLLSGVYIE